MQKVGLAFFGGKDRGVLMLHGFESGLCWFESHLVFRCSFFRGGAFFRLENHVFRRFLQLLGASGGASGVASPHPGLGRCRRAGRAVGEAPGAFGASCEEGDEVAIGGQPNK